MRPLISIVMPVYNAGIYLKDAINDILVQTYDNLELICVNDGSTDDSPAVLQFFADKDKRIKIVNQSNAGAAEARNNGMRIANGKYMMILDSDDRFEPQMLEKVLKKAEKCDADITIFDGWAFDRKTSVIVDMIILDDRYAPSIEVFSFRDAPDRIFQISSACPWNKLFKTVFLRENGLSFETSTYMNDVLFCISAMELANRITILNEKLISYRIGNPYSVSARKEKDLECSFNVLTDTLNVIKKSDRYSVIWKSYANYAWERIYVHILEVLNESNYPILIESLDRNLFEKFGINQLEKNDFVWEEGYDDYSCFRDKGIEGFLFRLFRKYSLYFLNNEFGADRKVIESRGVKIEWFFNIRRIPDGSRIILYGAGKKGIEIYKTNKKVKKYNIVLWVDKNPRDIPEDINIDYPDKIMDVEYDYIVVAVESVKVASEIINYLDAIVPNEKIVW